MSVLEIQCADDLADLTREAVQQVRKSKEYRDLVGAILMANHIADWHYVKDLQRNTFGEHERATMKACYPEWDILRKLANGTKHCKKQSSRAALQWEDTDFWDSPGHIGEDGHDWFVEFDGQTRSVTVLIETFLEKFSNSSTRPI